MLAVAACTSSPNATDAGRDAPRVCIEAEHPAPTASCIPNRCGNELFVGATCSRGGGECTHNGFRNAFLCTLDFDPTADLNICTMACVEDGDCGTGGVCTGNPGDPAAGRGCVPVACGPRDAGPGDDASTSDGGETDDAGADDAGASIDAGVTTDTGPSADTGAPDA